MIEQDAFDAAQELRAVAILDAESWEPETVGVTADAADFGRARQFKSCRANEFRGFGGVRLSVLTPISMAGGLAGAMLLLATPAHLFDVVIPWLLLLATLTFAIGARAGLALRDSQRLRPPPG